MKTIPLTQNRVALVDDVDYDFLITKKWSLHISRNKEYVARKEKGKQITIHRQIMTPPVGMSVDHIDGNGLNNQRSNLRICSHSQNMNNQGKRTTNTSGFKGVTLLKKRFKKGYKNIWRASISVKYKKIGLGDYPTKELAYAAYCNGAKKYHGIFANLG